MPRIEDDELDRYTHSGRSDHYGAPFSPEDDRYEPEAWEQMTDHLWSHRRTRKATKKQRSPRARLDGLTLTLPGKLVLGYLGIGAAVGIYRAIIAPPNTEGLVTAALLDVVSWPYSVYQWATSATPAPAVLPAGVRLTVGANRYGDTQRLPDWAKRL